jgi:hypothetical protein
MLYAKDDLLIQIPRILNIMGSSFFIAVIGICASITTQTTQGRSTPHFTGKAFDGQDAERKSIQQFYEKCPQSQEEPTRPINKKPYHAGTSQEKSSNKKRRIRRRREAARMLRDGQVDHVTQPNAHSTYERE